MPKREELNNPEGESQESPEQKEMSDSLKKMASEIEGEKDKQKEPAPGLETLNKNIDRLKEEPEYERIPLDLRELMENKTERNRGAYLQASKQIIRLERMRDEFGLSDSDIQLLAEQKNPYELAKTSKQKRLRLIEIIDMVKEADRKKQS